MPPMAVDDASRFVPAREPRRKSRGIGDVASREGPGPNCGVRKTFEWPRSPSPAATRVSHEHASSCRNEGDSPSPAIIQRPQDVADVPAILAKQPRQIIRGRFA